MAKRTLTSLKGVFASGIAANIKANGKKDLAFIFVPKAYGSAGVFTRSAFAAPPLTHTRKCMKRGILKALIVNSGCANAATGVAGMRDAKRTAAIAAKHLGIKPHEVAIASTGIIGKLLPMDKMEVGLKTLLTNPTARDGDATAKAIMTTDLTQKEVYVSAVIAGQRITVAGLLDDLALRALHRDMFGTAWTWAGRYRSSERNIGVPPEQVATGVRDLVADAALWLAAESPYGLHEAAVRFHHRLVAIHPFANGNGRHARAATDLILRASGALPFTWGARDAHDIAAVRSRYIAALRAADAGDITALMEFVIS